ncbi:sensor histidine kinase [Pseudomonas asplenii]|uniref:sensor histidine kinase n=1 Tax=Pseudomonas asplenii TaxID=53407 RepID=UPI0037C6D8F9
MRLSNFILDNLEPILQEWECFARSIETPFQSLDSAGLRNYAEHMLTCIARDIRMPQTAEQGFEKSWGRVPSDEADAVAQSHAQARWFAGFTLNQMVAEYRALRASVLRLWLADPSEDSIGRTEDMLRFNEAIDQALTESVASYEEVLEQTRRKVLGILGHDLRTPLGAILMSSDLLSSSSMLSDRELDLSTQIAISVRRANRIVNDLLDMARCNLAEGMTVQKEMVDLNDICAQIVRELQIVYPKASIIFESETPLFGKFDPSRIGQVFSNLIGNALQHGDRLQPINVALEQSTTHVRFSVHNQGEPIPPHILPFLFNPEERYSRYSETQCQSTTGLGLGLFIAAEIVSAHGGHVDVQSTQQKGTRFEVTIPRR